MGRKDAIPEDDLDGADAGDPLAHVDPHDGNTIMEGPLPEGAFESFEEEAPAEAAPEPSPAPPAAPAPPPPRKTEPPATKKRLATERGTKLRRASTAESYTKTSKPPSKIGKILKTVAFLLVFVGIPALVVAGFFVKDARGDSIWKSVAKSAGIIKEEPKKTGPKEPHPSQVAFNQVLDRLAMAENELNAIDRKVQAKQWDKASALEAVAALERIRESLEATEASLSKCVEFFCDVYPRNQDEYEKARTSGDQETMKRLDQEIGFSQYQEVTVKPDQANEAQRKLNRLRGLRNRLATEFPSRAEIEAGKLPGEIARKDPKKDDPKKDEPKKDDPKKDDPRKDDPKKDDPAKEFDVAKLNPYGESKPGAWMRYSVRSEDLTDLSQTRMLQDDVIVSMEKDHVLLRTHTLLEGKESPPTETRQPLASKAVKTEKVTVKGQEYECLLVEYASGRKTWIWSGGALPYRAALKIEAAGETFMATEVGEKSLKVQGQEVSCVYVELTGKEQQKETVRRTWYADVPGGWAQIETDSANERRTTRLLVEHGPSARPQFPKEETVRKDDPKKDDPKKDDPKKDDPRKEDPKKDDPKKDEPVQERTAEELLADADAAAQLGIDRLKEVGAAYRQGLPSDKQALRALKEKADSADTFFQAAIEGYLRAKSRGADESAMDRKIANCQKALGLVKKYRDAIEAELAK